MYAMRLFEDKEKVRSVYGFAPDDMTFELFYHGLVCFGNRNPAEAEIDFLDLVSRPEPQNFAVYQYLVSAMFENGKSIEDIMVYIKKWKDDAQSRGDDRAHRRASTMERIVLTAIKGRETK